jgi:hypothetical protein
MPTQTLSRAFGIVLALGLAGDVRAQPELRWKPGITLERDGADAPAISAGALSPDGTRAFTGHDNGTVRLWNALTGTELEVFKGHEDKVLAVQFPSKDLALSVSEKTVRWWKLPEGTHRDARPFKAERIHALALSDDGKTIAASVGGGKVLIHDLEGKSADETFTAHDGPVMALALSPDRATLATAGADGAVKLWRLQPRREPVVFKSPNNAIVRSLAFSPSGKTLASSHGREGIILWNIGASKERRLLKMSSQTCTVVAFAPDGLTLASGTANGGLRLWNVATGKSRVTFKEHAGQVHALSFAADSRGLATVSFDGTARLWRAHALDPKESVEPKLTKQEQEILLRDLRGTDEVRATQAAVALDVTPRQTLALLKGQLQPVIAAPPERIAKLLADLDNARFPVREKANKELEELGEAVVSALMKAIKNGLPLEPRRRVQLLLLRLEKMEASPALVVARRVVAVLERLGTNEARQVLVTLAGGVPEAHLTRYARSALERLDDP